MSEWTDDGIHPAASTAVQSEGLELLTE